MKKLIVFGNGLGMALDPGHFSLANAMKCVWENEDHFSADEKEVLGSLKGIDSSKGPTSENDLISTQKALGFLGPVDIRDFHFV